jgi:hypothetical protein
MTVPVCPYRMIVPRRQLVRVPTEFRCGLLRGAYALPRTAKAGGLPRCYRCEPLFTASSTRRHRTSIRQVIYRVTAPCFQGKQCPDCADDPDLPCPEAVNPHAIRRRSITHFLTEDVPIQIVGDRMNVSRKVLEGHYDKRSEEIKLEQRRGYLDSI